MAKISKGKCPRCDHDLAVEVVEFNEAEVLVEAYCLNRTCYPSVRFLTDVSWGKFVDCTGDQD